MKKTKKRIYKLSASLICGQPLRLEKDLELLEKGKIDQIHFDVMDGLFVPRYGLYPEILKATKAITDIPVDVHFMTEDPTKYLPAFIEAGADIIAVHAESCRHLHYTIKTIKDAGKKAGVVLNYATPLSVLDYILEDLDLVELMAINPGIVGHKIIPGIFKKISDLREKISQAGKKIDIEIDGGVNFESAPKMVKAGATVLVCGTSVIFNKEKPLNVKIKELRGVIDTLIKDYSK